MANVKPFRGIRYNPKKISELQTVVSQPYDRISVELQSRYYQLSDYNITRIIQGKGYDGDQPAGPNVYTRAREYFQKWMDEGILMREDEPAYYLYEQHFEVDGQSYVRTGIIAAVELTEFDEGIILPHERTHRGPKEDRLRLLQTLEVNAEQIFMLYPDPENRVNRLLRKAVGERSPDIDVVEQLYESDVQQRVWVITDSETIEAVQEAMAPMRNLIIADGHHRYETALNYRNAQRQANPDVPADAPFNYIQATLVSMNDPGLVVLPTHREICNFTANDVRTVLNRAEAYFEIKPVDDLETCLQAAHSAPHSYGFYGGSEIGFQVLNLKSDDLIDQLIPGDQSYEWKSLTVTVLHKILLEQVTEVPVQGIEDKSMVRYHRDPREAISNVDRGEGNFVFFLGPTRMNHIRAIAANGEKMPQKSTDFFPKVISGLTLMPVGISHN